MPDEANLVFTSGGSFSKYAEVTLLIHLSASLLILLTALTLIWRQARNSAAILGAFTLTALATHTLVRSAAMASSSMLFSARLIDFVQAAGLFLFFSALPDGRFHARWIRLMILAVVPASALLATGWGGLAVQHTLAIAIWLLILIVVVQKFRVSMERDQMVWVATAAILLAVSQWIGTPVQLLPLPRISLVALPPEIVGLFSITGLLLVVGALTCFLVIFLKDELFRIEVALNRVIVYVLLTLCVVGSYVLVVGYLSVLFQDDNNFWVSLLATGVIAVFFQPLRHHLQRGVNRLIYGEWANPYQLLILLGKRVEKADDPASALVLTADTVAQVLKLPYVAIALRFGEEMQVIAAHGPSQEKVSKIALLYGGQVIGELRVAPGSAGAPFSDADQNLLFDLARQVSVTAHAYILAYNLEQARLRLVNERGEARRQLGSDLHDGVANQLVGLNRQLELAQKEIFSDPGRSEGQLAEISQRLSALTSQVRKLAHQLYPPELELLGLVGALKEYLQTHPNPQVHLEVQNSLPQLPAEIETAIYYISLEALSNIFQHAQAQTCYIRLGISADGWKTSVYLEIRDDGRGLSGMSHEGLGLLSMQARAVEVGGTCKIQSAEGSGTTIFIRIPCTINTT